MSAKNSARNGSIDFLKFFFALIVCLYHFYGITAKHFVGGNFAVSFFAVVSGVFFFERYEKNKAHIDERFPVQTFKDRFSRFFPYTFQAFIM